jgi:FtsP/CotA-like multicopper oxidase with cupredoxin domain
MSILTNRREFLKNSTTLLACQVTRAMAAKSGLQQRPTDLTLRIGYVTQEVAPGFLYKTTAYNGVAPAPVIRLRQGIPSTVEIINETEHDELAHWHGLSVPVAVDGTMEEGSRTIPAGGRIRYTLTPEEPGTRYLHSHAMSSSPNLDRGTYSGQYAMVYVEPKQNPGAYDQEVFLVTHEWGPSLVSQARDSTDDDDQANGPLLTIPESTMEVEYDIGSVNGRALGSGQPLRVREGERVLVHLLNASATATQRFALAGHAFLIVALDGNMVPVQQLAEVLEIGPGERISALVEMRNPGIWILGAVSRNDREVGRMGTVVEYAGKSGAPQWIARPQPPWDYTIFGEHVPQSSLPQERILPMVIDRIAPDTDGMEKWTINGEDYDGVPTRLQSGERYRLVFQNRTDDDHPVHLHRYGFELTRVHGRTTSGIEKDVVILDRYGRLEVDFTPEATGLALFHCHQQMHMDNGFKKLFEVVS